MWEMFVVEHPLSGRRDLTVGGGRVTKVSRVVQSFSFAHKADTARHCHHVFPATTAIFHTLCKIISKTLQCLCNRKNQEELKAGFMVSLRTHVPPTGEKQEYCTNARPPAAQGS